MNLDDELLRCDECHHVGFPFEFKDTHIGRPEFRECPKCGCAAYHPRLSVRILLSMMWGIAGRTPVDSPRPNAGRA